MAFQLRAGRPAPADAFPHFTPALEARFARAESQAIRRARSSARRKTPGVQRAGGKSPGVSWRIEALSGGQTQQAVLESKKTAAQDFKGAYPECMKRLLAHIAAFFVAISTGCSEDKAMNAESAKPAALPEMPAGSESITLGAGCFWCTEAVFERLPGVHSVTSGYMGGQQKNPTYEQVCGGATGHAEVTKVVFDPAKLSLEKLLDTFWRAHDPTTLNRQGADIGTQYRSAIFYETDTQREIAEKSKAQAAKLFERPIVTEITKATEFYPAENYHQEYYRLNKDRNPYCRAVITPKLKKLGIE
jgi:peptide-methionine (S)-S-oxide reductase